MYTENPQLDFSIMQRSVSSERTIDIIRIKDF